MMKAVNYLVILCLTLFAFMHVAHADVCSPVKRPTKYLVQRSDYPAAILRSLGLEPVFGAKGSMSDLIRANNLKNANVIEPGMEIQIPFRCEEQALVWTLFDRDKDRLITLEKANFKTNSSTATTTAALPETETETETVVSVPPEKVQQNTIDILNQDSPTEPDVSTEGAPLEDSVSEALRYRMICEGEWTGSECITRYSVVYASALGSYYRYDGIDATTNDTAVLLSKFNPGINLGWANYWFENFKTDIGFSLSYLSINEEARGRPIDQSKKVLSTLYGFAKYEVGPMGISLGFSQADKVFYRFFKENIVVFDDGGVTVQLVPITKYRAALSYLVWQEGKYRLDAEVGFYSLSAGKSSGYDVMPGSGWDVSVSVQHDRVKEYVFGTINFGKSQQDTTIEKQDQTDLTLAFGYAWKIKDW